MWLAGPRGKAPPPSSGEATCGHPSRTQSLCLQRARESRSPLSAGFWRRGTQPAKARGEERRLLPERLQRPLGSLARWQHTPSRWRYPPGGPVCRPAGGQPCQQEALPWPERKGRSSQPDPHRSLGRTPLLLCPRTAVPLVRPPVWDSQAAPYLHPRRIPLRRLASLGS